MIITLPEALQKEAETLAKREGIDVETLVVRAVERFLHEQQYTRPSVFEARQRLQELNKLKLKNDVDLVTEIRQIRTEVAKLHWGKEELEQSQQYQVAERRTETL